MDKRETEANNNALYFIVVKISIQLYEYNSVTSVKFQELLRTLTIVVPYIYVIIGKSAVYRVGMKKREIINHCDVMGFCLFD